MPGPRSLAPDSVAAARHGEHGCRRVEADHPGAGPAGGRSPGQRSGAGSQVEHGGGCRPIGQGHRSSGGQGPRRDALQQARTGRRQDRLPVARVAEAGRVGVPGASANAALRGGRCRGAGASAKGAPGPTAAGARGSAGPGPLRLLPPRCDRRCRRVPPGTALRRRPRRRRRSPAAHPGAAVPPPAGRLPPPQRPGPTRSRCRSR